MSVPDFVISGSINGRAAEIKWTEADGFGDFHSLPVSLAELLDTEASVCFTPTGPCWPAAAWPDEVAFVTARESFDDYNIQFDLNATTVWEHLSYQYRLPDDVEG